MTPNEVKERLKKDKVDYILAQYVDLHGTCLLYTSPSPRD